MNKSKIHYKNKMAIYELSYFMKDYIDKDSVIICIGTDRCIGDSLGPLVGTILQHRFFPLPVYGSVSSPIHAINLCERISNIKGMHPHSNILAIDACLGEKNSIGEIHVRDYPIHPGKGVGKNLPDVGDTSIIGIIDSNDGGDIFLNKNIRLSFIMDMAEIIAESLFYSIYLKNLYHD
ncbi:spore protease YyaC [Clostridium sp. MSJ-4]|uniref:Spore protease YyaC n=1 Tax=Clostridium simiarum TaxID=2841506 RepID=A0ABS6EX88_9CLOT|nr:spore protease YyaC [Clostridium simiarum]MBU5590330.1 spore protease YyaC [Clostridium simiarum]